MKFHHRKVVVNFGGTSSSASRITDFIHRSDATVATFAAILIILIISFSFFNFRRKASPSFNEQFPVENVSSVENINETVTIASDDSAGAEKAIRSSESGFFDNQFSSFITSVTTFAALDSQVTYPDDVQRNQISMELQPHSNDAGGEDAETAEEPKRYAEETSLFSFSILPYFRSANDLEGTVMDEVSGTDRSPLDSKASTSRSALASASASASASRKTLTVASSAAETTSLKNEGGGVFLHSSKNALLGDKGSSRSTPDRSVLGHTQRESSGSTGVVVTANTNRENSSEITGNSEHSSIPEDTASSSSALPPGVFEVGGIKMMIALPMPIPLPYIPGLTASGDHSGSVAS